MLNHYLPLFTTFLKHKSFFSTVIGLILLCVRLLTHFPPLFTGPAKHKRFTLQYTGASCSHNPVSRPIYLLPEAQSFFFLVDAIYDTTTEQQLLFPCYLSAHQSKKKFVHTVVGVSSSSVYRTTRFPVLFTFFPNYIFLFSFVCSISSPSSASLLPHILVSVLILQPMSPGASECHDSLLFMTYSSWLLPSKHLTTSAPFPCLISSYYGTKKTGEGEYLSGEARSGGQ